MTAPLRVPLRGGLDLTTPDTDLSPGAARALLNYEVTQEGGYRRIGGYERFDGRPMPSNASHMTIRLVADPTGGVVGDTVEGATSGATAVIAAIDGDELVVTKVTDEFQVGENVTVTAVVIGVVEALATEDLSSKAQAQARHAAAEIYREDIQRVPGSGPVSVAGLGNTIYAWRANDDGTDFRLFRSTPSGWDRVGLGSEVYFNTGTAEPVEGEVVTDATTGGTAMITRVCRQTGSWGAGTAAGKFVVKDHVGAFNIGNNLTVGGAVIAVCASACAGIKLAPGGRVLTTRGLVGAASLTQKLYGCDGTNRGFEFDGTTYVPIDTGMALDKPNRVALFKNHLFFAFKKSVQHSAIADAYSWSPIFGAAELSVNGDVTDFNVKTGDNVSGAMIIHTTENPHVLYGNSSADWQLQSFNTEIKGVANTSQNLGAAYSLCEHGVVEFTASQNFGNFDSATLTSNVTPVIDAHSGRAVASAVHRSKGQYRIFYSDGFGLYLTIKNGQYLGCSTVEFPTPVYSACEGTDLNGAKAIFVGAANGGFVYQLDAGTSFDGEVLYSNMLLPFGAIGGNRVRKRYRRAALEIGEVSYLQFGFSYRLDYGDSTRAATSPTTTYSRDSTLVSWDAADLEWDAFNFDGHDLTPTVVDITGRGVSIALRLSNSLKYLEPFVLNAVTFHYEPGRLSRS